MSTRGSLRPPTGGTRSHVAFVGAGPGDPGLLTLRAAALLEVADVVATDLPDAAALLARCARPDVEVVRLAADADGTELARAARPRQVAALAVDGARVVRLVAGDATTFSSVAAEIAAVRTAGADVELVPGVSAAFAVPVYAGVPVAPTGTERVHVVHVTDPATELVAPGSGGADTVVVLGARGLLGGAAERLVALGWSPDAPAVVVSCATTTSQRSVEVALAKVGDVLGGLAEPVSLVVGDAVGQRDQLSWFENRPLFGWRVLVPRTKDQSTSVVEHLRELGADPVVVPTISVEPPRTPQQMDKAVRGLVTGRYEWVGFTSVNAVRAVREQLDALGLDARSFSGLRIAAVGGVTAEALREWGLEPDLVPSGEQSAKGLLEEWPAFDPQLDPIDRVLLPRADIATDTLVAGLQEMGWEVDDVTAYRTVRAAPPAAPVRDAIKSGGFDAVLFTSSSTVRNLVGIAGKPHASTVIACIGPRTAATAEEHGLRVDVLAPVPEVRALVDALAAHGAAGRAAAEGSGTEWARPSQRGPAARRRAR
ncbi:uroporphyrinogen-III synthase [Aquipuribacter hungaricus]|uniref:uroporphyrinogen-III C-methyltransferase n=2 Tax=Aquipuribacter hungaricus TaxID=545624 RepID=A0ABV7WH13_9MICO